MANFANSKVILLKDVRLDYFDIFKPAAPRAEKDKADLSKWRFKIKFLFDRDSDADKLARAAFMEAATGLWGANAPGVIQAMGRSNKALRDGASELNKDGSPKEAYQGKMFVSSSSKLKPVVVAHKLLHQAPVIIGEDGLGYQNGALVATPFPIVVPYRGCYVNVKLAFVAANAFGDAPMQVYSRFEAVQFARDGEAFGQGPNSPEGFDYDDSEATSASSLF